MNFAHGSLPIMFFNSIGPLSPRQKFHKARGEIIPVDQFLAPFAFISSCKSEGITVIEGWGGVHSLGGPIGSDNFKSDYIKEVWEKTKTDRQAFKNMHSSSKWRMDVLI